MKIGGYVKIKEDLQEMQYDGTWCNDEMTRMGGIVTKISEVISSNKYHLKHGCGWYWTEPMLLPATEEEYENAKKNRPEVGDIVLSNGQVGVYTGSSILKENGVLTSISHGTKIIKKFAPFKNGDFVRIRKTDDSINCGGHYYCFSSPTPYGIVDSTIGDFTYILGCGMLPNCLVEQADIDLETFYRQYLYKDIVVYRDRSRLNVEKVKKLATVLQQKATERFISAKYANQ